MFYFGRYRVFTWYGSTASYCSLHATNDINNVQATLTFGRRQKVQQTTFKNWVQQTTYLFIDIYVLYNNQSVIPISQAVSHVVTPTYIVVPSAVYVVSFLLYYSLLNIPFGKNESHHDNHGNLYISKFLHV